jgi:hypothetical protein
MFSVHALRGSVALMRGTGAPALFHVALQYLTSVGTTCMVNTQQSEASEKDRESHTLPHRAKLKSTRVIQP